jgi:hypothetical protein
MTLDWPKGASESGLARVGGLKAIPSVTGGAQNASFMMESGAFAALLNLAAGVG